LLRFELQDGREVLVCGTARWQVESEDGYVIGCEFLHTRNSTMLSELIESNSLVPPIRRERDRKNWISGRRLLTASAAVAAAGLIMVGFWWGRQTHWNALNLPAELQTISVSRATTPETISASAKSVEDLASAESLPDPKQAVTDPLWNSVEGYEQPYGLPLYVSPRPIEPYTDSRDIELPLLEPTVTASLVSEAFGNAASLPGLGELEPARP
jgi:hypothetical protein